MHSVGGFCDEAKMYISAGWGKMISIAICDDELIFCNRIYGLVIEYLTSREIVHQIKRYRSGVELLSDMQADLEYDIVFLDINMDELDGIETARKIREISNKPLIVFITAFISYASEGYKVNAIRYILKSDTNFEDSIQESIDIALEKMNYRNDVVEIDTSKEKVQLHTDRIRYIESRLHRVVYFTDEKSNEYSVYGKLDNIQNAVEHKGFCRVHQSYIVNMKWVKSVKRYQLELKDGTVINISKRYYKIVENEFLKCKGDV